MSRGHGRVERAIIELFKTGDTWTVEDLCRAAFPGLNRIERKHRVAARRAAHNVAEECGVGTVEAGIHCGPVLLFGRIGAPHDIISQAWRAALNRRNESARGGRPRAARRTRFSREIIDV